MASTAGQQAATGRQACKAAQDGKHAGRRSGSQSTHACAVACRRHTPVLAQCSRAPSIKMLHTQGAPTLQDNCCQELHH